MQRDGGKGGGCSRLFQDHREKSGVEVCLPLVDLSEVTAEKNLLCISSMWSFHG